MLWNSFVLWSSLIIKILEVIKKIVYLCQERNGQMLYKGIHMIVLQPYEIILGKKNWAGIHLYFMRLYYNDHEMMDIIKNLIVVVITQ